MSSRTGSDQRHDQAGIMIAMTALVWLRAMFAVTPAFAVAGLVWKACLQRRVDLDAGQA
jgi:hypothetical protein